VGDERTPIQIKLIAPPRYVMDTMTLDKDLGKSVLEKAIEVVTEKIIAAGGKLEVRRRGRGRPPLSSRGTGGGYGKAIACLALVGAALISPPECRED